MTMCKMCESSDSILVHNNAVLQSVLTYGAKVWDLSKPSESCWPQKCIIGEDAATMQALTGRSWKETINMVGTH